MTTLEHFFITSFVIVYRKTRLYESLYSFFRFQVTKFIYNKKLYFILYYNHQRYQVTSRYSNLGARPSKKNIKTDTTGKQQYKQRSTSVLPTMSRYSPDSRSVSLVSFCFMVDVNRESNQFVFRRIFEGYPQLDYTVTFPTSLLVQRPFPVILSKLTESVQHQVLIPDLRECSLYSLPILTSQLSYKL